MPTRPKKIADFTPKPLSEKLGLTTGQRAIFLNAPENFTKLLGKMPKGVDLQTKVDGEFDFIHAFYDSQKALQGELLKLRKTLRPAGMIWISWRKGSGTDLDRDTIWRLGARVGLEGVSSCAVDEEWSALKFMYPKDKRK